MLITLTNAAKSYLSSLINDQLDLLKVKKLNLRVTAQKPGTEKANIELSYCEEEAKKSLDIEIDCGDFTLYIDQFSTKALKDAVIDYKEHFENNKSIGSKLHISAPFLKVQQNIESYGHGENDLFERIKIFLEENVKPYLARHGGEVHLNSINQKENGLEVVLEFSGGCKGCSMISFTLKNSVEKLLKNAFHEIILISDVTDHSSNSGAFF
jgi:Fe/S biogenesis protein NfuA